MKDFKNAKKEYDNAFKSIGIYKEILDGLKCCPPKSKKVECKNSKSPHHLYIYDIRDVLRRQQEVAKNLLIIPVLVNSYSTSKTWKDNFIRPEYVRYHMENWLVNVVRLEDINLQLINTFLKFGINEKEINQRIIISHTHLPKDIKDYVILFAKGTQDIRKSRNYVTHVGYYSDSEIENLIEKAEMAMFIKEVMDNGLIATDRKLLNDAEIIETLNRRFFTKQYCNKKRRELCKNNLRIFKYCKAFNDKMLIKYKENLPALGE